MLLTHKKVFGMYAKAGGYREWATWNEFLSAYELYRCDSCGKYGELGEDLEPIEILDGDDYVYYCSDSCLVKVMETFNEVMSSETIEEIQFHHEILRS